ncbi:MAG: META domain-containing protein [Fibromonadaceae bacterium]|jgi:hypothetical protein|nr:META domain-containing protein [Fibromonadaceae bacterium]
MNKLSLSLALASLVFFAACSDEKETRADICKKGPSKECLKGKWQLNGVEDASGESHNRTPGTLSLDSDGSFDFSGGANNLQGSGGTWSVNGSTLTITYNDEPASDGEMSSSDDYNTMKIKSSGKAAVSQFKAGTSIPNPNPVEVFSYIGN